MATANSTETDITKSHPYTCNSCAVAFRHSDAQRAHMRTDWHRYNLKRKIADLPPVSSDDYNEKVLAAQASTKAVEAQAAFVKGCEICGKIYYSENAYRNHVESQKHKLRAVAAARGSRNGSVSATTESTTPAGASELEENAVKDPEVKAEFESIVAGMNEASIKEKAPLPGRAAPAPDADLGPEHPLSPEKKIVVEEVPLSRCLFCNYDSPNLKLSLSHMTRIHGLFIPEQGYLTDVDGLIGYMQAKIRHNHECLSCHKLRNTTDGIQTHMRDKGHCRIAFETEEEMIEVGQFYDFSSTYSDEEEDSDEDIQDVKQANGGVKIDADDEGWETDSSFSSLDSNELTSVPIDDRSESYSRLAKSRHHSSAAQRTHRNADGFHSHAHNHNNAVFYDDAEMHLPSGRVAGHRSLKKYFRQNLHNHPSAAERQERAQRLLEDGVQEDEDMEEADTDAPKSQALLKRGEAGMLGTTVSQKKEVRAAEQRGRTAVQRQQNRYQAKLEKQHNSQKHFRDPLLQ